jgi:hypothetical protein
MKARKVNGRVYIVLAVFIGFFILFSLLPFFSIGKVNAQTPAATPTPTPSPSPTIRATVTPIPSPSPSPSYTVAPSPTPVTSITPVPMPTATPTLYLPPFYNNSHYECLENSDCKTLQCKNSYCVNMFCQYIDKDEGAIDVIYDSNGNPTTTQCYCMDKPGSVGMICVPFVLNPTAPANPPTHVPLAPFDPACNSAADCGTDGLVCMGPTIQRKTYFCNYPGTANAQCLVSTSNVQNCDPTVHNQFYQTDTPSTCQKCVESGKTAYCAADLDKNGEKCFSQNTPGTCDNGQCRLGMKCNDPTIPLMGMDRYCRNGGNPSFIPWNSFDCSIMKCDPNNPNADGKGCVTTTAPDGRVCKYYYDNSYPSIGIPHYGKCKNGFCKESTSGLNYPGGPYY